ncbi:MAG: hypothetical protein ACTIIC_13480, partial [Brevibacterium aurantiacum]
PKAGAGSSNLPGGAITTADQADSRPHTRLRSPHIAHLHSGPSHGMVNLLHRIAFPDPPRQSSPAHQRPAIDDTAMPACAVARPNTLLNCGDNGHRHPNAENIVNSTRQ